jgi:hypothetical protein
VFFFRSDVANGALSDPNFTRNRSIAFSFIMQSNNVRIPRLACRFHRRGSIWQTDAAP